MKTISREKIIDFCARHACGFKTRRSADYKYWFSHFSSMDCDKLYAYYLAL